MFSIYGISSSSKAKKTPVYYIISIVMYIICFVQLYKCNAYTYTGIVLLF